MGNCNGGKVENVAMGTPIDLKFENCLCYEQIGNQETDNESQEAADLCCIDSSNICSCNNVVSIPNICGSNAMDIFSPISPTQIAGKFSPEPKAIKCQWAVIIASKSVLQFATKLDVYSIIQCCKYFTRDSFNRNQLFVSPAFCHLLLTSTLQQQLAHLTPIVSDQSLLLSTNAAARGNGNYNLLKNRLKRVESISSTSVQMQSHHLITLLVYMPQCTSIKMERFQLPSLQLLCKSCWLGKTLTVLCLGCNSEYVFIPNELISKLLHAVGKSLQTLKLQKILGMSCALFQDIVSHCTNVTELSVVSCLDVNNSSRIEFEWCHFMKFIEMQGSSLKHLDIRYSLQIDDNVLNYAAFHLQNGMLRHLLCSKTEPVQYNGYAECTPELFPYSTQASTGRGPLTRHCWARFQSNFDQSEVLFIDYTATVASIEEMEHLLYQRPPHADPKWNWCRFRNREIYYQWFELPVYQPMIASESAGDASMGPLSSSEFDTTVENSSDCITNARCYPMLEGAMKSVQEPGALQLCPPFVNMTRRPFV